MNLLIQACLHVGLTKQDSEHQVEVHLSFSMFLQIDRAEMLRGLRDILSWDSPGHCSTDGVQEMKSERRLMMLTPVKVRTFSAPVSRHSHLPTFCT